jgi:hypothetical protein
MLPSSKVIIYKNLGLLVHLFDELWQAAECGHAAQPPAVFECRRTADHAARRYVAWDPGLRRDHHTIADKTMADHSHLSGEHYIFPNA